MQPHIAPKTAEKLNGVFHPGERHQAIIEIAMSLVGDGMPQGQVFDTIRARFDPEKTDKEIWDVIHWCHQKNPTPSKSNGNGYRSGFYSKPAIPTPEPPEAKAKSFINGSRKRLKSPVEISTDLKGQAVQFLAAMYRPDEYVNIVRQFEMRGEKANPSGPGKTLLRDDWIEWFETKGVPATDAGAWIRVNPCKAVGSGSGGAICDSDITDHRYLMVESDRLSVDDQLAIYAKLKLPIVAVILSGGGSAHAWIRLDAIDKAAYAATAHRIISALSQFGFDQSNKNPSRLSRLPGAVRKIGASGDGLQSLIYLNPDVQPFSDETAEVIENQIAQRTLKRITIDEAIARSIGRYEELRQNRGNTGVMTGFSQFDKRTGGLKPGNLIVVAAQTNVGKSSFAMNVVNAALLSGKRVAMFSMEMDSGEITDILFAINCGVSRNTFNTANFTDQESEKIVAGIPDLKSRHLTICEESMMQPDQIRATCLEIKSDEGLDLIVVDYIQLVQSYLIKGESREQQVAAISRALLRLAKECKCPLIALSQLNDEGKVRDSRAIAHDAHVVILLEKEKKFMAKIVKGRSIPKFEWELEFDGEHCRMTDASPIGHDSERRYAD